MAILEWWDEIDRGSRGAYALSLWWEDYEGYCLALGRAFVL